MTLIPVDELRPYDAIGWGTYVIEIVRHEVPQYNVFTGDVEPREVYTVTSGLAEYVPVDELPDGTHVHDLRRDFVNEHSFDPGDRVPVVRPAPVIPCACGFNGGSEA